MCDIIGELAEVVRIIYAGEGEIGAGGAGRDWAEWENAGPHPSRASRDPPSPASGRSEVPSPRPLAGKVVERSDAGKGLTYILENTHEPG